MPTEIRAARRQDADAMARLINQIIAIGGTTAHRDPFDARRILDVFVAPKRAISCFVACDGSRITGFQALEWCDPDWPGPDPLPADWAVVATYVDPRAHRKGIGRALFAMTAQAAAEAGVRFIDATIRKENATGQAFYQGVGFTDYRIGEDTVAKRFRPG